MTVTLIIIIITSAVSVWAFQPNNTIFRQLDFNPYIISHTREYHRFLTNGLLHADWMHLIVNMYVLYVFGNGVETFFALVKGEMGHIIFLVFYILAIICSSIPSYEKHKNNPMYSAVGASGGTSAIVFSYIIFAPLSGFYLMFIPIEIPAIIFGVAYLIYSYYMAQKSNDNIAHDAHLFGALFGIIFTLALDKGIFSFFVEQLKQW